MQTLTLFELNEYIRRVLALNFNTPIWVTAEIAEVSLSKGHLYLSLVQQTSSDDAEEGIVAQSNAIIWQSTRRKIFMQYGQAAELALRQGLQTRIQVRVDYHERYGLKLHIEDIDPAYALGVMALQRRKTIEILQQEGCWDINRTRPLPSVIQRIAVITSAEAAGFQDFKTHIAENAYGYQFYFEWFFVAVQGKNAADEIGNALTSIARQAALFDIVVIIRGGGSKLDLSVFDHLQLCRNVAAMPLPVFTGIGHEIDESVLDMIAHRSLKTPTAVADFLVEYNLRFESKLLDLAGQIQQSAYTQLHWGAINVDQIRHQIVRSAQSMLSFSSGALHKFADDLPLLSRQYLQSENRKIDNFEQLIHAFSPESALHRGYTITLKNGKRTRAADLQPGETIETLFADGKMESKVLPIKAK